MFGASKGVDAKMVNNALVVSFMTADPPRVWRADLTGLASATLELREAQPGTFRLVLKRGEGQEEEVSSFKDKDAAADAMRAVTAAMMSADPAAVAAAMPGAAAAIYAAPEQGSRFGKALAWIAAIIVTIMLLGKGMILLQPHVPQSLPSGVTQGQPVPADKLFGDGK